MKRPTRTYVVILNYNGAEDTIHCVESLVLSGFPESRIVLVDNASTDDSVNRLSSKFESLNIVANPTNLGYAGGNNVGIRVAIAGLADGILILNSDTTVGKETLRRLEEAIEFNENVGIVGPIVAKGNDPTMIESAGARVSWYRGTSVLLHQDESVLEIDQNSEFVDYVSGCAMLILKDVIDDVGMLADHFFLYGEEKDFCIRARRNGYGVLCSHSAVVYHQGGRSTGKVPGMKEYYLTRNRFLFMKRLGKPLQIFTFITVSLVAEMLFFLFRDALRGSGLFLTVARTRGAISGLKMFLDEPRLQEGSWNENK